MGNTLIPVGSVEEHGYHLPLSTDTVIAEMLAENISTKTGILVAPPIWYGVCRKTSAYPGTVNVKPQTLQSIVEDVLEDLNRHGFERFYLLTGHAGSIHISVLKEAGRSISINKNVQVYVINPFQIDVSDLIDSQAGHACEVETSLMLYLRSDLVKMEKAVSGFFKEDKFFTLSFDRPSESGVSGRPELASKEKGSKIFERLIAEMIEFIESKGKP